MGNNPSYWSRQGLGANKVRLISDEDLKRFPVESVSWNDALQFLGRLNEREKGRGWTYLLPMEVQWEYACRGAANAKEDCSFDFYLDRPANVLSLRQANFIENGKGVGRPMPVGSYPPNKLGLYDMHGNVAQWCFDPWDTPGKQAIRGSSYATFGARFCSAAYRYGQAPTYRLLNLGFRVIRVPAGRP
jgi:formylglycine-generating enzyme required for sulfatase activity